MNVKTATKRDQILKIAAEVFLESGFEGGSIAQIVARVGGSKATLYGYFKSKEHLFVEVALQAASDHMKDVADALLHDKGTLEVVLQRYGEHVLAALCAPQAIKARRAVMAEAGRSDIGVRFFRDGPAQGLLMLRHFLKSRMKRGELHPTDPLLAAHHLMGMLYSETLTPALFGAKPDLSPGFLAQATGRAVTVFLRAYAVGATGADPAVLAHMHAWNPTAESDTAPDANAPE